MEYILKMNHMNLSIRINVGKYYINESNLKRS